MHSVAFLSFENKASICFVLDCIIPWQILWSMVILHCCNIETLHPLTCVPELITLKFPKELLQWKINRTSKTSSMIWAVKIMSRVYCDSCNIPFLKNIFLLYTHWLCFAAEQLTGNIARHLLQTWHCLPQTSTLQREACLLTWASDMNQLFHCLLCLPFQSLLNWNGHLSIGIVFIPLLFSLFTLA